jgi:hypothetical protein
MSSPYEFVYRGAFSFPFVTRADVARARAARQADGSLAVGRRAAGR